MQLSSIFLFALSAAAFTIPEGQPDGVYIVTYDSNGTSTHTALQPPSRVVRQRSFDTGLVSPPAAPETPDYEVYCSGKYILDDGDTDKANAALDAQCDSITEATEEADCLKNNGGAKCFTGQTGPIAPGKDAYSISGSVVAFFCNFEEGGVAGGHLFCTSADRSTSSVAVTAKCGSYIPGWANWQNNWSYGYQAAV